MSLESRYNEIMEKKREQNALEEQVVDLGMLPGENWQLIESIHDGKPYVKVTCAGCKQIWHTQALTLKIQHCGRTVEMSPELSARLEAMQIAKGIRQPRVKPSFVQRILGTPAPNHF